MIDLVLGVARLGEAGLRGWWQSHGLDQAGQYALGGSFPRTWRCAALELAITSAKRRQEEMLGRPTALHLFSDELPFRRLASAWLAEQKTGSRARSERTARVVDAGQPVDGRHGTSDAGISGVPPERTTPAHPTLHRPAGQVEDPDILLLKRLLGPLRIESDDELAPVDTAAHVAIERSTASTVESPPHLRRAH